MSRKTGRDHSAANLTVRAGSLTILEPDPQVGQEVTATFIIDNLGDEAVIATIEDPVIVKLYNCADSDTSTPLGTHEIIEEEG